MKISRTQLFYCGVMIIIVCGTLSACDDGATGNKPGDTDGDSDILIDGDTWDAVHADGDSDIPDLAGSEFSPDCLPEIVAPEVLDFGPVAVDHWLELEYEIRNTGCADLVVEKREILDTGFMPEFVIKGSPAYDMFPFVVAPGESYIGHVVYYAKDAGADESELYVHTNMPGSEIITIRLISQVQPSRLCYRVLDGNSRDLEDGILDMGEVKEGETANRTIRMWNCEPRNTGGILLLTELEREPENDIFTLMYSMAGIPWGLKPSGINIPSNSCVERGECADLTVSYNPSSQGNQAVQQDVAQIRFTYNASDEKDKVFYFSAQGTVKYTGLKVFPLNPGCNGVRFDATHYIGYVIRNYTQQEFLVVDAGLYDPPGVLAGVHYDLHRSVENITLGPGEEYLLVIKYEPHSEPGIDERHDPFDLQVRYCDTSEDECVPGHPASFLVMQDVFLQSETCTAQTDPAGDERDINGVLASSCNNELLFSANVSQGSQNCGYEWDWLEKPLDSVPTIEGTLPGNPEGTWEQVRVTPDLAGLYLLAHQRRNCNNGYLQYIGLSAILAECGPD